MGAVGAASRTILGLGLLGVVLLSSYKAISSPLREVASNPTLMSMAIAPLASPALKVTETFVRVPPMDGPPLRATRKLDVSAGALEGPDGIEGSGEIDVNVAVLALSPRLKPKSSDTLPLALMLRLPDEVTSPSGAILRLKSSGACRLGRLNLRLMPKSNWLFWVLNVKVNGPLVNAGNV